MAREPHEWSALARWLVLFGSRCGYVRALLGLGKHDLPVAHFTSAGLHAERLDPLMLNQLSVASVVHEQPSVLSHLHEERLALTHLPVIGSHLIDQEHTTFRVDLDCSVAQLRYCNCDRATAGTTHDLVDELLRKRIEND